MKNKTALTATISVLFVFLLIASLVRLQIISRGNPFLFPIYGDPEKDAARRAKRNAIDWNELVSLDETTVAPLEIWDYKFLTGGYKIPALAGILGGRENTGVYPLWNSVENQFRAMMNMQRNVLMYVRTRSNNNNSTLPTYFRCMKILRDFAERFVYAYNRPSFRDWRMYVVTSGEHFARCMYFVKDKRLFKLSEACMYYLIKSPYKLAGRISDDVDDVTASRAACAWIISRLAIDRHSTSWQDHPEYVRLRKNLQDSRAKLFSVPIPPSFGTGRRLFGDTYVKLDTFNGRVGTEEVPLDEFVWLRDNGRLWRGRVPFYGDLWHRYVFSRRFREFDRTAKLRDTAVSTLTRRDIAMLSLLVHKQIKRVAFGLFGNGSSVPNYWLWPATKFGVACIPSIGFLRMYNQRWAISCRAIKRDLPFYTYRAGNFNSFHLHLMTHQRFFTTPSFSGMSLFDEGMYQPGSIVLDGESEAWVLRNCRIRFENNGTHVSLYPINANSVVMCSKTTGLMIQEYEMFRGLRIREVVLLDYRNGYIHSHVHIENKTGKRGTYYASMHRNGIIHPFEESAVLYSRANYDDEELTTSLYCKPLDKLEIIGKSNWPVSYTRFLQNDTIFHTFEVEDPPGRVKILTADCTVNFPPTLKVLGSERFAFDEELNQYAQRFTESEKSVTSEPRVANARNLFSDSESLDETFAPANSNIVATMSSTSVARQQIHANRRRSTFFGNLDEDKNYKDFVTLTYEDDAFTSIIRNSIARTEPNLVGVAGILSTEQISMIRRNDIGPQALSGVCGTKWPPKNIKFVQRIVSVAKESDTNTAAVEVQTDSAKLCCVCTPDCEWNWPPQISDSSMMQHLRDDFPEMNHVTKRRRRTTRITCSRND